VEFQQTGTWYDFFSGSPFEVPESPLTMELAPGEFHVFTSVPVETPEPGLITVGSEPVVGLPESVELEQNFPNPVDGSTTIRFAMSRTESVRLEVFDLLGRRVGTLVDGSLPARVHEIEYDARDLSSGVYLYRLTAGGRVETRRMLVVR
jgi:hypothetical protein